jgi:hypothetical protein
MAVHFKKQSRRHYHHSVVTTPKMVLDPTHRLHKLFVMWVRQTPCRSETVLWAAQFLIDLRRTNPRLQPKAA